MASWGQQPPSGGGPDGSLDAEVERRLRKEERQEDRQLRREARERAYTIEQDRRQQDSAASVYFITAFNIIQALMLLISFCGTGWAQKGWSGFGVSVFWIRTGLIYMEVKIECNAKFIEDKLCVVAQVANGHYPLHTGVNVMCAISDRACQIMNQLFLCSFIVFGTTIVQIIMMIIGSVMLYTYWNSEPLPRIRRLAVMLYMSAPMLGLTGIAAWTMLTPDIGQLPHAWTTFSSTFTGGVPVLGYTPLFEPYFGWCWCWAVAVNVLNLIGLSIWLCFFSKHRLEEQTKENQLRARELLEDGATNMDVDLLAANLGATTAAGQAGGYHTCAAAYPQPAMYQPQPAAHQGAW